MIINEEKLQKGKFLLFYNWKPRQRTPSWEDFTSGINYYCLDENINLDEDLILEDHHYFVNGDIEVHGNIVLHNATLDCFGELSAGSVIGEGSVISRRIIASSVELRGNLSVLTYLEDSIAVDINSLTLEGNLQIFTSHMPIFKKLKVSGNILVKSNHPGSLKSNTGDFIDQLKNADSAQYVVDF